MLKIGNVNVAVPVALAPMAGVTDLPYRLICKEFGCGLTCTELISAKAIKYNNKNTDILLKTDAKEAPTIIQLFGSDPDIMAEIAKRVEELTFDIIDINMGCPVPKVVNNGEGSALMKTPILAGKIIEKMASAVKKPVTVKIRSGFSSKEINAPELAHIAMESGAAAVTVHARTREQYYSGEADRSVIKAVKERVSIPVIGNGDIRGGEDALSMMRETGCDGVMIGRRARGNPWIFAEVYDTFAKAGIVEPDERFKVNVISAEDKRDMLLRHLKSLCEFKGEYTAVREMRKHFGWYMAGEHGASALRRRINEAASLEEFEAVVKGG